MLENTTGNFVKMIKEIHSPNWKSYGLMYVFEQSFIFVDKNVFHSYYCPGASSTFLHLLFSLFMNVWVETLDVSAKNNSTCSIGTVIILLSQIYTCDLLSQVTRAIL